MAKALDQFPAQPGDRLNQLASLVQRLEDGDRRIREAQIENRDVAAWETFWIELLRQYEALLNESPEAVAA